MSLRTILILFLCLGCRVTGTESPRAESVRPGINDNFLSPELDVESYAGRFEGESREIFVQREGILAMLGLSEGQDVADIGAGTGLFTGPFSKAVGPSGTVYAVDISPGFLEHLRERGEKEGWTNVELVLCSEDSADLPKNSVDLAFVCDTYHHFEYPQATLASLRHALRPGGRLVVIDFERIPGVTREFLLGHVRAGKQVFRDEILVAGFEGPKEVDLEGLVENYVLIFRNP